MAYAIFAFAIAQLILATCNFCKVPKSLPGFFILYTNFCTMFFTFIIAFIMMSN